ncbi:MAG: GHKL domain-containing protein [Candidatus Cloacimonetes bacterium]|nr:GHKL domain-containing protein [Candidatus Cloacimonadota bacterium]
MKKKKAALERRIFILFFTITFILVLIILGLAWIITNYQINRLVILMELLAVTLFAVIVLGLWFSKTIMQPINRLSEKFQEISKNPSKFEPILEKYGGKLGEVVETFNAMNRDLAEFSKAQQEYKVITDNLDIGIFWMDSEFKIILCNPSFVRIFELNNYKEVINKNISEFIKLNELYLQNAKEDYITIPVLELDLSNQKKYVMLNIRAVKGEAGLRLVGSITNITKEVKERKAREALELELIKSNKLAEIGRRVEGIVHNINSPLNSILGYAQLIKKEFSDNEDINKILEAGKNISRSVKVLLKKVQKDDISTMVPININELIKQELELCKHNLFFKHYVMLETSFFKDLPEIKTVYSDISQSFVNIMNNAIESLKNSIEKYIWVRTYRTSDMIAIEIQDTGEGIKNKYLDIIFEPYYSTKVQKDGSGFGLGLAISKSVVERYGGYISVKSKVGKGSTFILFFPINE